MNYYKVIAKRGHVGKGRYIVKDIYVMADDGRESCIKRPLVSKS